MHHNAFSQKHAASLTDEVIDGIVARVRDGRWSAGVMIPSETELADLFDVSQGTVRRALQHLVTRGLLVRRQGKGTFVTSRIEQTVAQRVSWFAKNGEEAQPHATRRVFSFQGLELVAANARMSEALEVPVGSPLWHIRRESTYAGMDAICCFDEVYLPQNLFPDLSERELAEGAYTDLYALYEARWGNSAFTFDELARAVFLNPEQAQKAQVTLPWPAICIRRVSRNVSGRPIELRYLTNVTEEQNLVLSWERCV